MWGIPSVPLLVLSILCQVLTEVGGGIPTVHNPQETEILEPNSPSLQSSPGQKNSRVHVLTEIVHESNAKFLRISRSLALSSFTMNEDSSACINSSSATVQGPRIPLYPSAFSKSTANVHSADWLVATEHENAVAPTMHKLSSISHELDLPLLQTGGIHAHLALDNLAVQAIFQPDIVAFWEVAMGINTDTMLRTEVDTALEGRRGRGRGR